MTDAPQWFADALALPGRAATHRLADGRGLALRIWGNGPRVVLLVHGGAANARWWDHIAPMLLTPPETIVAVDLAGHGASDWRSSAGGSTYDLETWADDLVELLAAQAPSARAPAPVVVGHSMGGLVGWTAAARRDARMLGLIAIDSPIGDLRMAAAAPIRPVRPHRIYRDQAEILARFRTLPEQPVTLPYVLRHIARSSIKPVEGGWTWRHDPAVLHHAFATAAVPGPGRTHLSLLACEDGLLRPATMRYLADTVGERIELLALPRTGHHAMLDQPHRLVRALRETIDSWYAVDRD
jgi:pimeloyl-ACP methyl ester carboxylesterase